MFVHFIWIGPNPLPKKCEKYIDTWRHVYPEATITIHGDEATGLLSAKNRKHFDSAKTFATKADILRYAIIYEFGGIYSDVDIEVRRRVDFPAEFLLEEVAPICVNGLFGVKTPGHPGLNAILQDIETSFLPDWKPNRTGPRMISKYAEHFAETLPASTMHWNPAHRLCLVAPDAPLCHHSMHTWKGADY